VACLAGPNAAPPANCSTFDFDIDGDVDLQDFATIQNLIAAP